MTSYTLWIAFVVSALLRVAWILTAHDSTLPYYDIDDYLVRAQDLLRSDLSLATALSDPPLGVLRPPLYIGFLALSLHLGLPMVWILVVQAVVASLVVVAVGRLSSATGGETAGVWGAWLAACWPQWITSAASLGGEHFDTPLVAAALAMTVLAHRHAGRPHALGAGLAFGVAALTRSTSLYLSIVMMALVASRRRAAAIIMLAGMLAVTVPYVVVISTSAGRLVLIENLFEWNWTVERVGRVTEEAASARLWDLPSNVVTVATRNPVGTLRSAFGRLRNVMVSVDFWDYMLREQAPPWLLRLRAPLFGGCLMVLYLGALLGTFSARDRNGALLLVVWVALHCLLVLASAAIEVRHRSPFEPALIALAAAGLARLYLVVRASGIGGAGRLAQW